MTRRRPATVLDVLREHGYAGTEHAVAVELRRLLRAGRRYERQTSDKPAGETPQSQQTQGA